MTPEPGSPDPARPEEPARPERPAARVPLIRLVRGNRSHDPSDPGAPAAPGAPGPTLRDRLIAPSAVSILVGLLAGVLAGGLSAASVLTREPVYRSQTVVEIRRPDLFLDVNPGTITVLNALRSKYAALIATEPVVIPAAESIGASPEFVAGAVTATITSDSLLFYPAATADEPEVAQIVAQVATEALVAYAAEEQRAADVPGEEQIELRIVQNAFPGGEIGPDSGRATFVGLVAGMAAALVAYVLANLRRIEWRRPRA